MTNSSVSVPAASSRAELVQIFERTLSDVARFIAEQSKEAPQVVGERLRWLLIENPARDPGTPLGWGLRSSAGEFVGCILCVPQRFRHEESTYVVMGSSSFYVDEVHRGMGGLIFLKYSQLSSRWPLFGNSANAEAAQLWKARGAVSIGFSDHELLGIINWGPVIEETVARKTGGQMLPYLTGQLIAPFAIPFRRLKTRCAESGELYPLTSADQVVTLAIAEVSAAKITAVRDLPYIQWRYFSGRDTSAAAFAYRSKQLNRDIFVSVNQRARGYRGQVKALNVLDIYPEVSPESCVAIVDALLRWYFPTIDVVILRGQDPDRQRVFREAGFLRREFEAPNAWFLDRFSLIPKCNWYLVPADGDWLI